jgi:hypothetical protein
MHTQEPSADWKGLLREMAKAQAQPILRQTRHGLLQDDWQTIAANPDVRIVLQYERFAAATINRVPRPSY